jgi:hypothetical protein
MDGPSSDKKGVQAVTTGHSRANLSSAEGSGRPQSWDLTDTIKWRKFKG